MVFLWLTRETWKERYLYQLILHICIQILKILGQQSRHYILPNLIYLGEHDCYAMVRLVNDSLLSYLIKPFFSVGKFSCFRYILITYIYIKYARHTIKFQKWIEHSNDFNQDHATWMVCIEFRFEKGLHVINILSSYFHLGAHS